MAETNAFRLARFWSKVKVGSANACWPWEGSTNDGGYGVFHDGERNVKAHRFAYSIVTGEIPEGAVVRHACDNPPCCNPRHLVGGSTAENNADMKSKGRGVGPKGARNARTKLSAEAVAAIKASIEPGHVLASRHSVAPSTISMIRSGSRRAD